MRVWGDEGTCKYLNPPQISLLLRLDVSFEKSPRSMHAVFSPRVCASNAAPAPVQPPPTMMTSKGSPPFSAFTISERVRTFSGSSPRFTRLLNRWIFFCVTAPVKSLSSCGFSKKRYVM